LFSNKNASVAKERVARKTIRIYKEVHKTLSSGSLLHVLHASEIRVTAKSGLVSLTDIVDDFAKE